MNLRKVRGLVARGHRCARSIVNKFALSVVAEVFIAEAWILQQNIDRIQAETGDPAIKPEAHLIEHCLFYRRIPPV